MDDVEREDGWTVLGLGPDASDEDVRRAYVAGVRAHPPDRDPEGFARIRAAYEGLRTVAHRTAVSVLGSPDLPDVAPRLRAMAEERLSLTDADARRLLIRLAVSAVLGGAEEGFMPLAQWPADAKTGGTAHLAMEEGRGAEGATGRGEGSPVRP